MGEGDARAMSEGARGWGLLECARVSALARIALVAALASGCALEQRMSMEVVDAPLRGQGEEVRAGSAGRGEVRIGGATARALERTRSTRGEPLLTDQVARPSTFHGLRFEVVMADGRAWRVACRAQRRVASNADLAAEAEESHDQVALRCELSGPGGEVWALVADGDVGRGLVGEVRAAGAASRVYEVEVIAQRTFLRAVPRALPIAVAQLRRARRAEAAMLLAAPERAWLARTLAPAERELALVTMLALRLSPIAEV